MGACLRFEQERLLQLERSTPLDPHFDTCPDCCAARAFYERLQHEIAAGEPFAPPAGWQRRVLDRIAAEKTPPSSRRHPSMYVAGFAVAATILIALALPTLLRNPAPAGLRVEIQGIAGTPRAALVPGGTVSAGTRIQIEAATGAARFAELRVYRNDDLLVTTAGGGAGRDSLHITLLLDPIGRYQPVLLLSDDTIPPALGTLDTDVAAALRAGVRPITGSPINVR